MSCWAKTNSFEIEPMSSNVKFDQDQVRPSLDQVRLVQC